jgi:RNA polymerase sigma-70 factor (ECF subfamily)
LEEAVIFESGYQNKQMGTVPENVHPLSIEHFMPFEYVFKKHFKDLHAYASAILKDTSEAEEIVQNVFYKLWEKQDRLQIKQSLTSYLYRSVYHESLNHLKRAKIKLAYQSYAKNSMEDSSNADEKISLRELEQRLEKALNELPEKCRTVFQLSRFEELKYQEIADRLQISVKTVENHMGKALKLLRHKLVDFLPAIILVLLNL